MEEGRLGAPGTVGEGARAMEEERLGAPGTVGEGMEGEEVRVRGED